MVRPGGMSAPHPHALHTDGEIALDAKALDETADGAESPSTPLQAHEATREPPGVAMAFKLNESAQARWQAVNAARGLPGP